MQASGEFGLRIDSLDLSVFDDLETQSSRGDKTAWLAIQRAVRTAMPSYAYLEIGSHLGGSLQQYMRDPRCAVVWSIDRRPPRQPDDRGTTYVYDDNSSQRMIELLRRLDRDASDKVVCFDSDASEVNPASIEVAPSICFIDGEHTHSAVLSDFAFCLRVCAKNAIVYFHDDGVVLRALHQILGELARRDVAFRALKFGGTPLRLRWRARRS